MLEIAKRLRSRMEELGLRHVDLMRLTDFASGRLGNYTSLSVSNNRTPDVRALIKLAKALHTTTDYLLGLEEVGSGESKDVLAKVLELDGMSPARAARNADIAHAATKLLASLPGNVDPKTKADLAAFAAWQVRDAHQPMTTEN